MTAHTDQGKHLVAAAARRPEAAALLALLLAWATLSVAAADADGELPTAPSVPVIVLGHDATTTAAAVEAVEARDGTVEHAYEALGGVSATVPADVVESLRAAPGIRAVEADRPVKLQSASHAGYDPTAHHGSLWWLGELTGAHDLWRDGYTGAGVDVALIDSGIVPVPGLDDEDRVLHGPDLSLESVHPDLRHLDAFGHGTHLAGIIAANEGGRADPDDALRAQGMAPDARLISLKVAEQRGVADVSQIIAAIDWVIANRTLHGLNIRVLTLAFSTDSQQGYVLDPLSFAVEQAWKRGIVVVVAAGNGGQATTTLPMPAVNPHVLAVGAVDTGDNASPDDDAVAAFSSRGSGARRPDLVAPGTRVVSLRSPGSYLDETYPAARIGQAMFRGSGTSQAAAVVSGLVALLIERYPGYTPDQILHLVTTHADPLPSTSSRLQGNGVIDVRGAADAWPLGPSLLYTQGHLPSTGLGSVDGARGSLRIVDGATPLVGEQDIMGQALDTVEWTLETTLGQAFVDGWWNGNRWSGDGWTGNRWSGDGWSGNRWSGNRWSDDEWTGNRWSGDGWSGDGWNGNRWSNEDWSGSRWSTAEWE